MRTIGGRGDRRIKKSWRITMGQEPRTKANPTTALANASPCGEIRSRPTAESPINRIIASYERREQSVADQIHERLAQKLFGVLLHLEAFEHGEKTSEAASRFLGTAKGALGEVISETRRLVARLRFPTFEDPNLIRDINHLICELDGAPGREIEFLHPSRMPRLSPRVEIAVFRVVQELLANACRHSQAERIHIRLSQDADRVVVEVKDWGIGFDPAKIGEGCFGLRDVLDRVAMLGGRAAIHTAPNQGAEIVVELPMENPDSNDDERQGDTATPRPWPLIPGP